MMRRLMLCSLPLVLLLPGLLSAEEACTVAAVSTHAGLTFTDAEPLSVRARVTGFAVAPVTVDFALSPWEGARLQAGDVQVTELKAGAGEAPLPLRALERGLYRLTLKARSGDREAAVGTSLAVVFAPPPVSETSPWGIFYIPHPVAGFSSAEAKRELARNIRLLGGSWVRFNFWAGIFGKIAISDDRTRVEADWSEARQMVRALRAEGLYVMGELAQCPRELSSRPDETSVVGDAGPLYNRVKPADYRLWDQLMRKLAADFADDIQVWEIWNEVNLVNCYWSGTPEEFVELVHHSAGALKQGNPAAKIAAGGFTGGHDYADRLLTLGMGSDLDILSVHYTDERPSHLSQWQALLRKHNLNLPIWNTEEKSEVPLENLAGPIVRSFKFCHINIGYDAYRLLVNKDLTPRPSAVWYSVGAHFLDGARYLGRGLASPDYEALRFDTPAGPLTVLRPQQATGAKLLRTLNALTVSVTPVETGRPVRVTDEWGRTTELPATKQTAVPLRRVLYLQGAREVRVAAVEKTLEPGVVVAEAEAGQHAPGWGVCSHQGFSEGSTVDIWSDADPGAEGYWAEVKFAVPAAGEYEVLFSGNGLDRLAAPRSISPFAWQIDGGEMHEAKQALAVAGEVPGAPEGLSTLGRVRLPAGEHTFRLRLIARRDTPDKYWALWFDALALRPLRQ